MHTTLQIIFIRIRHGMGLIPIPGWTARVWLEITWLVKNILKIKWQSQCNADEWMSSCFFCLIAIVYSPRTIVHTGSNIFFNKIIRFTKSLILMSNSTSQFLIFLTFWDHTTRILRAHNLVHQSSFPLELISESNPIQWKWFFFHTIYHI